MTERLRTTLIRHTNHRGLILVSARTLSGTLSLSPEKIREGIEQLSAGGEIEILNPFPFLVARASSWPGKKPFSMKKPQQIRSETPKAHMKVPVSSEAAAATHTVDGGAGEGGLLAEVLEALGPEAGREEFARILAGRSPALVHRCLARVRATKRIRVSKAALFRALLQKLSH